MSVSSSTLTAEEDEPNSFAFLNPVKAIKEVGSYLKKYIKTSYHNTKSALLSPLSEDGDLSHCEITSERASSITLKSIRKFNKILHNKYFNNITKTQQCKRDVYLPGGCQLTYSNIQEWFPEFSPIVSSLLDIPYVEEHHLYFTATITAAWGLGTKHPDMMKYLVRIIFTFVISTGELKKQFVFYHPDYNNGEGEAIEVGSHEFVVLDSKSGGVNDKKFQHQAKIADSDVLTLVVSVHGENLPRKNVSQFLADWKKVLGEFEELEIA